MASSGKYTSAGAPLIDGIEWSYLRTGSVVHARQPLGSTGVLSYTAVCGTSPTWFDFWYGTGTQSEYERADRMPPCWRCLTRLNRVRPKIEGDDASSAQSH